MLIWRTETSRYPTLYLLYRGHALRRVEACLTHRLRVAGMQFETRKVLLGHRSDDLTSHCLAPEFGDLLKAASRVCSGRSRKTLAGLLLRQEAEAIREEAA